MLPEHTSPRISPLADKQKRETTSTQEDDMIRRYSAKSKDELLLMMWIDINQDFPISHVKWIVEQCFDKDYDIMRTLHMLDEIVILWRSQQ